MGELLFKIQDTFQFESIGLVVEVNIKIKDARLKIGDEIELRPVEDSPLITKVASISRLSPFDPERMFSFSLPKGITKKHVPIGTEVWSHP